MEFNDIRSLTKKNDSKIVLVVIDGLGGLPQKPGGKTELESAKTPNLDRLAAEGICGLHEPVRPGITPGSGPAHLGVFGYDPIKYKVGRGVLAALGIGFDLKHADVAARGNFCTVDSNGRVTDRRAGRIPTEMNEKLCRILSEIKLSEGEIFVRPVKEYRFLLVIRGENLSGDIADTDPQEIGVEPLAVETLSEKAGKTARLVTEFIDQARKRLADHSPANMALMRGFSQRPDWPAFPDIFGVRAAAIAAYPMYRGVASLVGMDVLKTGDQVADEFTTLEQHWQEYDFFYLHVKKTDSAGEDGDFDRKVKLIEEADALIPRLRSLNADVIVVTGDHSTPSLMKSHSWHPVPVLLWSKVCRADSVSKFGEGACLSGALGVRFPAVELMPLAMANAHRLEKFGA
jgi:2,3-bisphosphoglycerate-independent phosphoglycerate mutase